MELRLRPATARDVPRLNEIVIAAKSHWGYPREWIELWRDELEFRPEHVERWAIACAERGGDVVGVCAVSFGDEPEIEGLWVDPTAMRSGVGGALVRWAADTARSRGVRSLLIVSDPNAEPFYAKHGAVRVGDVASRPKGRRLPMLRLALTR